MSTWAERLKEKYFGDAVHPYEVFEQTVLANLGPQDTLLDAGCGREAPVLARFRGRAQELIGVDVVDFRSVTPGLTLLKRDLTDTGLPDCSVNIIMARSVMEHIVDPFATYREMNRVLAPGGHFIFLTANMWDYATLLAKLIPNRWHPWIVARAEGRKEEDVFPIQYKTNTRRTVSRFAGQTGFDLVSFSYLGQYPSYFLFSGPLFLLATAYEKLTDKVRRLRFLKGWILVVLRKK